MIRNSSRALTVALGLTLVPFTAGCGTSDDSNGPVDASTTDGAVTLDAASLQDATSPSDGSGNANDAAAEAASDAPDPSICTPQASNACISCCEGLYPVGFQKFAKIELTCACVPTYCGPLDGGAGEGGSSDAAPGDAAATGDAATGDAATGDAATGDAAASDAGLYGEGACAVTCTQQVNADDSCVACIRQTLGSTSSPGPCGIDVLAQCVEDPDCAPYFSCIEECP